MCHYIEYVQTLIACDLKPMPTLFHHAWPLWLENGFEEAESVQAFTEFAEYVFNAFKKQIYSSIFLFGLLLMKLLVMLSLLMCMVNIHPEKNIVLN